jgi:hypothetical protein
MSEKEFNRLIADLSEEQVNELVDQWAREVLLLLSESRGGRQYLRRHVDAVARQIFSLMAVLFTLSVLLEVYL